MQQKLIPAILDSKNDYFVEYETGSGKTMSMLLGILAVAIQDMNEYGFISSKNIIEIKGDNETELEPVTHAFDSPSTIILVPNRELAIQIEAWAKELISDAFKNLPSEYLIQSFVKGSQFEKTQQDNLSIYGVPSVVIGTPSRLYELIVKSSLIPINMRLKRIFIDEVDTIIQLLGKNTNLDKRLVRIKNPKSGQLLVESIFSKIHKNYPQLSNNLKSKNKIKPLEGINNENTLNKTASSLQEGISSQLQKLTKISEQIKNSRKKDRIVNEIRRIESDISHPDLITPTQKSFKNHNISLFCISATISSDLRKFLKSRGWFPNPVKIIQQLRKKNIKSISGDNSSLKSHVFVVPKHTTHSCLVVEVQSNIIRNLRLKEKKLDPNSTIPENPQPNDEYKEPQITSKEGFKIKYTPEGLQIFENDTSFDPDHLIYNKPSSLIDLPDKKLLKIKSSENQTRGDGYQGYFSEVDQKKYNDIMAECINNILIAEENLVQNVVIFLESNRDYNSFVSKLNEFGIEVNDIIQKSSFSGPQASLSNLPLDSDSITFKNTENAANNQIEDSLNTPQNGKKVFVLTDSSGRGLDIQGVSHVILAGVPKSTNSYLHMSGRTGRFGKPGRVITILLDTANSKGEGKMRGIYSKLNITNFLLEYIQD
ncbi:DEAD-box ATP-dependent RNA helicase CshC [Smittium mucronatum]|uniref:ATP-dependent RNA helicase n=1 Tax=Smittium mucronatum TaxID=133383 RepID=A0A1R0GV11_9FUNG|nr:DEAD-box ATP-dependent RNA helicase CshC [Smittium mucronatum]